MLMRSLKFTFRGFKSLRDPSRKMRLEKRRRNHLSKLKIVLCASSSRIIDGNIEFWSVSAIKKINI